MKSVLIRCLCCFCAALALFVSPAQSSAQEASDGDFHSAWPARVEQRAGLSVHVGPIRVIMRAARSALPTAFSDGSILVSGGSREAGTQTIRSSDRGNTWRPQELKVAHLNTLELSDGRMLVLDYKPEPIADKPGHYRTKRWISHDQGRTLEEMPDGATLQLPPEQFDPKLVHWFHGNLVEVGNELLTVMQGEEVVDGRSTWRTFLVRSRDAGESWQYVSIVANHRGLAPIRKELEKNGWRLHGSVEPSLVHVGAQHLICITRVVDDESQIPPEQYGPASDTYHDLNHTVSGDGIHPSMTTLPADKYFTPGPPSAPLIIMHSRDGGKQWSRPQPMRQARGCFPRTAMSDGILALTYGGLGTPRWGNCISFSTDGGRNWTDEVNIGPFLTTGYTGLVSTGPGKFLVFFDCTPPQPWTNDYAWWIGAVDIEVKRSGQRTSSGAQRE